jgi:transcription elongation factor GreA
MEREVVLTEEGFHRLKEEIEYLSTIKRREVAARIKEAREFGDISENSEYDDAKNEQAQVEARILGLEQQLRNARVVDAEHVSTESVSIGAKVTLKDLATKKNTEADPRAHKLSSESPLGKAVIGKKKGEKITVTTPRGPIEYQVMKIQTGG